MIASRADAWASLALSCWEREHVGRLLSDTLHGSRRYTTSELDALRDRYEVAVQGCDHWAAVAVELTLADSQSV